MRFFSNHMHIFNEFTYGYICVITVLYSWISNKIFNFDFCKDGKDSEEKLNLKVRLSLLCTTLCISYPCYELFSKEVISIITNVNNNSLKLSEYVGDLTIKSDEKINLDVRVCCLFLSRPVLSSFSQTKLSLCHYFFYSLQLPEYVVDLTFNR